MAKYISIFCLVMAIAALGYFIYRAVKIVKNHVPGQEKYTFAKKEKTELIALCCFVGAFLAIAGICLVAAKNYKLDFFEYVAIILGALIFGTSLTAGVGAFTFYFYKADLDEKTRKICHYWPLTGVLVLLSLWLFTEGVANHIIYPLVSGLSFSDGFVRPDEVSSGITIKFYGILIVSGALLCYAITDHEFFIKFKQHGIIDTLFVVAFLSGIIGARLWYCLVLEPEYFLSDPVQILYIFQGGLAIQGGAILGIIAGVVFLRVFRKYVSPRFLIDVAVPTILLAQVIGRWGNFFNQEVYGAATTAKALWFVPTIVEKNMFIDGEYRIPLFFIEGCMNLAGYFFIRYFLGKVCKFRIGTGYQASFYLVWYGMVRAVLELFRDKEFRYMQSWYVAFGMMAGGLALFTFFYFFHKYRMKNGIEDKDGNKIKKQEPQND